VQQMMIESSSYVEWLGNDIGADHPATFFNQTKFWQMLLDSTYQFTKGA